MQYRPFGKLDFQVSALGFGTMRLPTKDGKIDEDEAARIVHYAIDKGVNYIDTAYPYHQGTSEVFLGRALQGGYRDKVKLATKLPSWLVKTADDFDRFLNEQLKRLQVEYVDFYLLHSLDLKSWQKLRQLGVYEWAEKAIASGRFRYLGFSFHDSFDAFKQMVDDYDWTMCLMQYNYMDIENQGGIKGLKYAASKGLAIAIMEPLQGGKLVKPPQPVQHIWDKAERKRTPVGWGLQWLWNQPEVSVVLSGMGSMEQVQENIMWAEQSGVGLLTPDELALYDEVRACYNALAAIPCTDCRYCMPCPQGVNIPGNFSIYNEALTYGREEAARRRYRRMEDRAELCIQCQQCEDNCPQSIPISKWMPVLHTALGEGGEFKRSV